MNEIALDFETTSLDPEQAEIVSIGAVRIQGNRLLTGEALAIKVQPPASLTSQSVVIHGLRHQDLQQGMTLEAALRLLLDFIGPRELVGYHIAYDLRILNLACQKLWGLTLPQRGVEGEPALSRPALSPLSRCGHQPAPECHLQPS